MDAIRQDLKGADFEKRLVKTTDEGIPVRPFYRKEDLPDDPIWKTAPGDPPYLRGGRKDGAWAIRQGFRAPNLRETNEHARYALMRGCEQVSFVLYPAGTRILTQKDFSDLLEGVYLEAVPVSFVGGPLCPQLLAMYANEASRRGLRLEELLGSFDFDPITNSVRGWSTGPIEEWKQRLDPVVDFGFRRLPKMKVVAIHAQAYEEAGASAAQQIAFALGILHEYLAGAAVPKVELAKRVEIRHGIGSNYLLEIAKLRASRVLVQRVLESHGVSVVRPPVHSVTSSANLAAYDPNVNMLRATTQAMSAVLGGTDSLAVLAYDIPLGSPDQFSERIARNVQILLREEAYLGRVADPLGGAYAIEALTYQLCEVSWKLFQQIQAAGGFVAAWKSGMISEQVAKVVAAKRKAFATRRKTIVGVTVSPNSEERRLDRFDPIRPFGSVAPADYSVEELCSRFNKGMSLQRPAPLPDRPILEAYHPSEPFEDLRMQVELAERTPTVYLFQIGDPSWRKARAEFATGFFGVGGFHVSRGVHSAPAEVAGIEADVVVLCSSDAEYANFAPPFAQAARGVPVIAGHPDEQIEALRAAGIEEFVHVRSDVLATLQSLLRRLEVS